MGETQAVRAHEIPGIDVGRYPLEDPTSPAYEALVADARRQLVDTGAVEFPGFVTTSGVEALVADAEELACRAHHSEGLGTPYLELPADGWPAEHPRQTWSRYAVGAVPYDAIPRSSPLRQLYEWEPLCDLVEAVVDRGPLYRYADPFGALNLAVMGEGEELQWHFDQTDFVVSVAIQTADSGGYFEVHPRIRSEGDEHYDEVAAVLAGYGETCVTLPMTPGTLLVFEGRNSLHRVSPVGGGLVRHVGLLAFDTQPDRVGSELLRHDRYGRSQPFAEPPVGWPPSHQGVEA